MASVLKGDPEASGAVRQSAKEVLERLIPRWKKKDIQQACPIDVLCNWRSGCPASF
jgi:hypothetical protein